MTTNKPNVLTVLNRWRCNGWGICSVALIAAAAASLVTARMMHATNVKADSGRVFELDIYHVVPGKVPALASRFRDASQLQAKHGLNVIGYWCLTVIPHGTTRLSTWWPKQAEMTRIEIGAGFMPILNFRGTLTPSRPSC